MAKTKNVYRENKPKDLKEQSTKSSKLKSKSVLKGKFSGLKIFFQDERKQRIFGGFLLVLSVYLFFAFLSYLFTWKIDQDKLFGSWYELIVSDIQVENWLGKFGAICSHLFLYNWFGLASFLVVLFLFISGFKISFKFSILPIGKTFRYSLFLIIWTSLFFGFIFSQKHLGGSYGYHSSAWLNLVFGKLGTLILLSFLIFGFLFYNFNKEVKHLWSTIFGASKKKEEFLDEDDHTAINSIKSEDIIVEDPTETGSLDDLELELNENKEAFTKVSTEPIEENKLSSDEDEELTTDIELESTINTDATTKDTEESSLADPVSLEVVEESEAPTGEGEMEVEVAKVADGEILSDKEINKKVEEFGEYDPKLDLSSYQLPPIDLLENHGDSSICVDKDELEGNKNRILETLNNYNIKIAKIKATIGPTVTLYEIVPAPGVRISKIKNLEDDIALSLSALGIRIIAPIPGKGTIGIEVPNSKPDIVSMRNLIASDKFQNSEMQLPIALGKTIANETYICDLAKMPHLLMAGATGQGKSVGLNAILASLLYKKHPSQVKFVLVDPKKVELTLFNKIERHFLAKLPDDEEAIITDTSKVVASLNSLCSEMDHRYELLKEAQVRNIIEYNNKFIKRRLNPEKGHKYLPYIVLVVDEFADLIMTAGKEVETPIARLAQLARAIGIHLIIATQRPSVNIITGTIKANFPARIAFRVTSRIDSRTILDAGGADQLIGRGDLLLSTGNELIRLQCGFLDTPEVEKICNFIGEQRAYPSAFLLPEYHDESGSEGGGVDLDTEKDAKFEEAARIIVMHQQGSTSLLQRKLKLGYNRAGRIVDQLESVGIIGPFEGSKARKVLIPDEYALEQFLRNLEEKNEKV